MYEPAGRQFPSLVFLWPAFAAASASDMAAVIAKHFASLAVGPAAHGFCLGAAKRARTEPTAAAPAITPPIFLNFRRRASGFGSDARDVGTSISVLGSSVVMS